MTSHSFSLVLSLYCLASITALAPPLRLHTISANSSLPQILLPNSLPNLTAPTPPLGFSVHLDFNSSIQLKPIQVYQSTIELISILSNLAWVFNLPGSLTITGKDTSTEIFLDRYPQTGNSRLQVQYAVLGLYQAGVAIAQSGKFYQLIATMYVNDDKVGWLEWRPRQDSLHESSSVIHTAPLNLGYANDTNVMADSGKLIDPSDPNFVVTYHWDGVRIKAQDVFTVVLDAFALAAEHKNTLLDAYVPAARSASGDVVLSTWTLGERGNPHMTWERLKRILHLVWDYLIIGKQGRKTRFEGFEFGIKYEGKDIGAGRVLRLDMDGGDAAEGTVE